VLKFEVLGGKSNESYGNYSFLLWKSNGQIHKEWFGNPMTKLSKSKDSFENLDIEFVFRSKGVWLFFSLV
jgi:hypothetical protein